MKTFFTACVTANTTYIASISTSSSVVSPYIGILKTSISLSQKLSSLKLFSLKTTLKSFCDSSEIELSSSAFLRKTQTFLTTLAEMT